MLQNRLYRRDIVHQGEAYPGQHEAILDPELWQIVQDKLTANRREPPISTPHGLRRRQNQSSRIGVLGRAGKLDGVPGAQTKAPRKGPGRSQNSTGQCLVPQAATLVGSDLQQLAGTCDRDRPRLHRLWNLAHEVDV
jgi:hypothetical protein